MKIVIGYLFYDILNLYGESGNILAIEKYLKENNIEYETKKLTIEDEIDFNELDFVYMGSGTDENEYLALENLKKYKDEIKEQIDNNKLFLVTGNAIELFGKEILEEDGNIKEALNIFDYSTEKLNTRIVSEIKYKCDFLNSEIIGFANHNGETKDITNSLFYEVENNEIKEGIKENNFYGTYTIGPILARNDELLEYLIKQVTKNKDKEKVLN